MKHKHDFSDYHVDSSDFDDYVPVATYAYPDQWNRPLHQKVRCELKPEVKPYEGQRSKFFYWEHLEEEIGTNHYHVLSGRGDKPPVHYRLPELARAAPGGIRYVCEGEKDTETLLKLDPHAVATTAPSIWEWPAKLQEILCRN